MNGLWFVRPTVLNVLLAIASGGTAVAQNTAPEPASPVLGSTSPVSSPTESTPGEPAAPNATPARKAARIVSPPAASRQVDLYREPVRPFSEFAIGLEAGTLGIGVQVATPLTRTFNFRAGADFLNFGNNFSVDGAQYEGQAHLRSGHISLDWHPLGGGFRISPELLLFQSGFSAAVYVPGGQSFELGNTAFLSSATDPVHGGASIAMARRVMPALTIGFGNMLGERHRHWSIPAEIGSAYTGHYTLKLNLAGTACFNYIACMSTSSQQVQTSVRQEESTINETMKHFQVYPIVGTGIAYRF